MLSSKHVVKMIVESAQMLSTAHRVLDGYQTVEKSKAGRNLKRWHHKDERLDEILYKSTHVNHPCNIWIRESVENYRWLYSHFKFLSIEYEKRYEKTHLSWQKLGVTLAAEPKNIPHVAATEPRMAMPSEYIVLGNPVESYRNYYKAEKLQNIEDSVRYTVVSGDFEPVEDELPKDFLKDLE